MHLLATSPLKSYCKSTRKHHQSSVLHRPNLSSADIARKEKQKPGQNVPDSVLEPRVCSPGGAGLDNAPAGCMQHAGQRTPAQPR